MSNAKRLLKNSLFLYARMLIVMGIGFFTTRKILEALGVVDLGISNVVCSITGMFDFISSSLTNSTQRFLNVGLGKNDPKLTNQYFSQSLLLQVALTFVLAIIVYPVGMWLIHNKMVIPIERLDAAIWVFRFSVISLVIRLTRISFESSVIARERMSFYAYLSIIEGVGKLLICYLIIYNNSFDKLIYYGFCLLALNFSITLFNAGYCMLNFPESRFRFYADKGVFKQLTSFIGLNSVGVISYAFAKNGVDILINMFFGPALNAAKGLATQLDRLVSQFGTNIDLAIRPQITKMAAGQEYDEMVKLAMKGSRYIFFVMLFVAMPFLFETESVLKIWLGNVPDYTETFVRILVFNLLFTTINTPFNDVSMAIGKIKNIQVYGRLFFTVSILPIGYLILHFWKSPNLLLAVEAFLALLYTLFIAWEDNRYLHFGMVRYIKKVIEPAGLMLGILVMIGLSVSIIPVLGNVYVDFFVKSVLLWFLSFGIIWLFGVEKEDRCVVVDYIRNKFFRK